MCIVHRLIIPGIAFSLIMLGTLPAADAPPSNKPPEIKQPIMFNTPEADAIVAHLQVFPKDNPWNTDVSKWPLHPDSDAMIATIGTRKPLRCNDDMGYILVPPDQKKIDLKNVAYRDESDPGPFPLPDNVPIEGWPSNFMRNAKTKSLTLDDVQRDKIGQGGDRHASVVDPVNHKLYEFYQLKKTDSGWQAAQTSIFDLDSNKLRPEGWTSTDAAGLPIFPATVRYDELQAGVIKHALRVTIRNSRHAYVYPATHQASRKTDKNLPRMGERIRLKADYDISKFSPPVKTILQALKTYGMLVADNGLEWSLSIAPDERIEPLHAELRKVTGDAFEVVVAPK
jgi:hypothetical protein